MLNINNSTAYLKREILVKIAKLQLNGELAQGADRIPREILPKGSDPFRCCLFHDREILRQRVIARLGCSLEDYDEDKFLSEYVEESLTRKKPTSPILTVLDEACNACVKSQFMVTNACQACIARPCMVNCGKKSISIKDGRAFIDSSTCVNCGLCLNNCPYHAIIKIPVPCEESCPVGAIEKNENGKERIDYEKCIFCGNCMRECPFGAMMDKGQLVDVIKHIMAGKKVVAIYAPAVAAQFRVAPGQLEAALLEAGFGKTWEVAIGADITSDKEAKEFEERMEHGEKIMTTSCCPAYVRAVNIHVPELIPCVSETHTPMHYTAELAKQDDPDCICVFIGPCLAKRREGMDDKYVDYVLSVEEIGAFFIAKEIEIGKSEAIVQSVIPTSSGRNFATTGGVAEAVRIRLQNPAKLKAAVINGLDKAGMKQLAQYGKVQSGALPCNDDTPNLVEVMTCEGGCIGGPSVITNIKVAGMQLKKYVETGAAHPE
ncbi:MAG: monomeric [FeFe] hydrogenase [Spirochaetales bacterium]